MEKFDQYAHKESYGLPRTAKLKGFLIVNEEQDDMLALYVDSGDILRTAYTKDPKHVMLFQDINKAQAIVEEIGKPLLISALYETKKQFLVACVFKYTPN
ncbi:hypothetical protein [Acinetobacter nosocomialis]|uniref:hypothetical protein n=1 Tax=Acinetobacter nosocomialis TaxID=106654 RepID=UPI000DE69960|nr:hypothetical protein [Acinetobacter nosocomialis]SSV77580.1 Uncharacterised protein [Acinetobacter nosocomialis]